MRRVLLVVLMLLLPSLAWSYVLPTLPTPVGTACGTSSGTTIAATTAVEFAAALVTAAALDEANGTTITLTAGANFIGPFTLPVKTGDGCITIRTSAADGALPGATVRIDPTYASVLPKILAPGGNGRAIKAADGAHHYKFLGVEISIVSEGAVDVQFVEIGRGLMTSLSEMPHHIEFDRVYVHAFSLTSTQRRGLSLNGAYITVQNSYLSGFKEVGADTQTMLIVNGTGPYRIHNNYLEAAGENIIVGGSDPKIPDVVPSDITVTNNTFSKLLSWKIGDPTYAGTAWTIKNLFELKLGIRVLLDGNILEYCWTGQSDQAGYAILITVRNQSGTATWSEVRDVTISNNLIRHTVRGINMFGRDVNFSPPTPQQKRILVKNNLWLDIGFGGGAQTGWGIVYGTNPVDLGAAEDFTVDHNTFINSGLTLYLGDSTVYKGVGFTWQNNIHYHNTYGVVGGGSSSGTASLNKYLSTPYVYTNNVMITNPVPSSYPTGNFNAADTAAVGWTNTSLDDYSLTGGSAYHNAATDGTDIGVDMVALNAALLNSEGGTPDPGPGPPAKVMGGRTIARHPSVAHWATFLWTPNTESDLAGYRIYPRLSAGLYGPYIKQVTTETAYADKTPLTQYLFKFAVAGTYCFAVSAYNQAGIEGEKSDEVCVTGVGVTRTAAGARTSRSPNP